MMHKLKLLLLYDGLENKEAYNSVVGDVKNQNRKVISLYSLIVLILCFSLFIASFFVENLVVNRLTYLYISMIVGFIGGGMYFLGKKNLHVNTIFTYLFATVLLSFATAIGAINEPSSPAIAYCVIITILPFVTYDMALRSLLYRVIMIIIYFVLAFIYKDRSIIWIDLVDIICYGSVGAIIGIMNQKTKTSAYYLSRNMNREIEIKTAQIENITAETISAMSDTLEAKDEYTRGHSNRVSEYAALIAEEMNLPKDTVDKIRYAATLHDIGKIGVPDIILNKPEKLTDEEYNIIKTHSTIGSDILRNINMISYTSDIARHHHERYDGKGYPDCLKGKEISIGARIVAVADAFDAMNSKRVYRNPLDIENIKSELIKNKGIQFDPKVVDAFIGLLNSDAIL